ncbi:hypothetical protein JRI60_03310 [Archangium violaceum]|uniref:ELWxxDGT repeat protein n=1 Tax=Archangium violaceum TaxID=83451 RepID=UPI001950AEEF|nr:ELWxxDGT repeat protein [Archangium violaceum]QRN98117.1 hypothetical protein JRI60_03310 [Archangium violaceum]
MPSHPIPRFRPLSVLFLSLALGCSGEPRDTENPEPSLSELQFPETSSADRRPPGLRPSLVKDIQVGTDETLHSSEKSSYTNMLDAVVTSTGLYFAAGEESTGVELWRTDGTLEGTRIVRDTAPGPTGSIFELATSNDTVYLLSAASGTLWKSDGTAEGTTELMPGTWRNPANLVSCNGQLFFSEGGDTPSLWKTDGTPGGTFRLATSVWIDWNVSEPPYTVCANGTLFFVKRGVGGEVDELWKSDGTPEGTVRLASIGPVMPSPNTGATLVAVGSRVFLNTGYSWGQIWTSDGTPEGTVPLTSPTSETRPLITSHLTAAGGRAWFIDGFGPGLWTSDGTESGTRKVADIPWNSSVQLSAMGDSLLFSWGEGLYRTGGSPESTTFLGNINLSGYSPAARLPDGRYLLSAGEDPGTPELWLSDGTEAGTTPLRMTQGRSVPYPARFTRFGDRVMFWAMDEFHGAEPWMTDGTPGGTHLLRDIHRGDASNPQHLTKVGGTLFFSAHDAEHGRELWKTDGTSEGTVLVKDIGPAALHTEGPHMLTPVGDSLFFFHAGDRGLWKTDGTGAGTVRLARVEFQPYNPAQVGSLGTAFFFSTWTSAQGSELWRSDGTPEGTGLFKDINPGSGSAQPSGLRRMGDTLYFSAFDPQHGSELWKTDGTPEGTVLVGEIRPGNMGSGPSRHTAVGSTLFFVADDGVHGRELWKSDGTAEGTVLVEDINPGGSGSEATDLVELAGTLFFIAHDGVHGRELWRSDGTAEGTVLVADISPGPDSGFAIDFSDTTRLLNVIGDELYFTASDGVHGNELWKSDGTAGGTTLFRDLTPGSASSPLVGVPLVPVGKHGAFAFAFASPQGVDGMEPWMSDGTPEGTRRLVDLARGPMSSSPSQLTVSGSRLFFVADEGVHGRELWSVKKAAFHQHP